MSRSNRFCLAKYGSQYRKKLQCPNCGKFRFVPFFDLKENRLCAPEFGRCDRESGCGYMLAPTATKGEKFTPPPPIPELPIMEIDRKYYLPSMSQKLSKNSLFNAFSKKIDEHRLKMAFFNYRIGTSNRGGCIFWQFTKENVCRAGKIINYDENGHRVKSEYPAAWVHKLLPELIEGKRLQQCLFGEHLLSLYPEKTVAIVESEKTSLIMSILQPEFLWIATGGSNNINATGAPMALFDRKVKLLPDDGQWFNWSKKAQQYGWEMVDWSAGKSINHGDDILDLMIKNL